MLEVIAAADDDPKNFGQRSFRISVTDKPMWPLRTFSVAPGLDVVPDSFRPMLASGHITQMAWYVVLAVHETSYED